MVSGLGESSPCTGCVKHLNYSISPSIPKEHVIIIIPQKRNSHSETLNRAPQTLRSKGLQAPKPRILRGGRQGRVRRDSGPQAEGSEFSPDPCPCPPTGGSPNFLADRRDQKSGRWRNVGPTQCQSQTTSLQLPSPPPTATGQLLSVFSVEKSGPTTLSLVVVETARCLFCFEHHRATSIVKFLISFHLMIWH